MRAVMRSEHKDPTRRWQTAIFVFLGLANGLTDVTLSGGNELPTEFSFASNGFLKVISSYLVSCDLWSKRGADTRDFLKNFQKMSARVVSFMPVRHL
jgi:hypothetical protein